MARIRHAWDAFESYLDADRAPPLIEEDTLLRDDVAWLEAAESYVRFKEAYDGAAANLDAAKVALLALANAPRQEGGGVQVTRFTKQGTVDYKRVPALRGIDLDQFRGPSREETRITLKPVAWT